VAVDGLAIHDQALADLAGTVGLPARYSRMMMNSSDAGIRELFNTNFNELMHSERFRNQRFLARTYNIGGKELPEWMSDASEAPSVLRCIKSPSFEFFDNLEVAAAIIVAASKRGLNPDDIHVDLSDRRMIVRLWDRSVEARAKDFLQGYRNPVVGEHERDDTVMFAGLVISNSDVGASALSVQRQVVARVCTNGYRVTWGAKKDNRWSRYHRGAVKTEGRIDWSPDTLRSQQETLTKEIGDVVEKFLDPEMLKADVAHLNEFGTEPIPTDGILERLGKATSTLGVTDTDLALIVSDFLGGGRHDRAGIAHAFTSASQRVDSVERADLLDASAMKVAENV
jgi:hypothetical protein